MSLRSCYNCHFLKNNQSWYKSFVCAVDDEVLDEYNLKLNCCNCYTKKIKRNENQKER